MISFVSCSSPMLLNKKRKDITRLELFNHCKGVLTSSDFSPKQTPTYCWAKQREQSSCVFFLPLHGPAWAAKPKICSKNFEDRTWRKECNTGVVLIFLLQGCHVLANAAAANAADAAADAVNATADAASAADAESTAHAASADAQSADATADATSTNANHLRCSSRCRPAWFT